MADTAPAGPDLGTYRRKKITSTDVKMGSPSKPLTDACHLDDTVFEPGSVQIVVSLTYAHGHNITDNDDGRTVHLDQMLDPRVAAVLPEGSLRTELLTFLDDVAAKVNAAKADAERGQATLRAVP